MAGIDIYRTDDAVLYVYDLVGGVGDSAFVRHDNDCDPVLPVEPAQKLHNLKAGFRVKGTGRLVGKYDAGRCDQCPGNGDSLLLSAGELVGIMLGPGPKSQSVKIFQCHPVPLLSGHALIEKREFHVFDCGLERNEVE